MHYKTTSVSGLADLGEHLRKARKMAGMTQARLALQGGVSRAVVNQLENGVLGDLGIRKILRICAVLGLSLKLTAADEPPVLGDGTFSEEEHQ